MAGGTEPELEAHRLRATALLEQAIAEIDDALRNDDGTEVNVTTLAALSRPLSIMRRALLPYFVHYRAEERYLTLLTSALAEQTALPVLTPIVGTFSPSGYRTDTAYFTLTVPAGEAGHLLALPDLAHELGHLALTEQAGEVLTDFARDALGPYTQSLASSTGVNGAYLYRQYLTRWAREFIADAIATYVCGPAFGWQHIRLNAQSGALSRDIPWLPAEPPPPERSSSHPADTARKTSISTILRRTGHPEAANQLDQRWSELTSGAGAPPSTFAVTYPEQLCVSLCELTISWCKENDVKPFFARQSGSVVDRISEAWELHLENPVAFAESEAEQVRQLRESIEATA